MYAYLRMALVASSLLVLAACSAQEDHASVLQGTPDDWWSDNYFAMLQAAGSDESADAAAKPIRIRLYH